MRTFLAGYLASLLLINGCDFNRHHQPPEVSKNYLTEYYPLAAVQKPDTDTGQTVALAFSGGGSRALSATMGQMRGLRHLGVLEKSKFISSVSGGSWASTLYTYLPMNISDDDFLGSIVEPGKLWWKFFDNKKAASNLDYLPTHNMGTVPQRLDIFEDIAKVIEFRDKYGYPGNELWVRLIGQRIFKPFGLSSVDRYGRPTRFYSYDNNYVTNSVIANNASLKPEDFYLVQRPRPKLIVNTSMFATKDRDAELLPVESTSFRAGIRGTFSGKGIQGRDIGGGHVQPFAFGSGDQKEEGKDKAQVSVTQRFSLSDISGLSSAAFAEKLEALHNKYLDDLIPKYNYWPVSNAFKPKNTATEYWFADGGNLANTGVIPLLARRVPVIISFVNSEEALEKRNMINGKPVIRVDDSLPPLFGYVPLGDGEMYRKYSEIKNVPQKYKVFSGNHVFADTNKVPAFDNLMHGLWMAKQAGGPVIFVQELDVIPNSKFNVTGGNSYKVKMVWVYNSKVENWWNKLTGKLRFDLDADRPQFSTFPHYDTVLQLGLSPAQVNLLAHMSAWNIVQDEYKIPSAGVTSKTLFKSLYDKSQKM